MKAAMLCSICCLCHYYRVCIENTFNRCLKHIWYLLTQQGDLHVYVHVCACVCVCLFAGLWSNTSQIDTHSFFPSLYFLCESSLLISCNVLFFYTVKLLPELQSKCRLRFDQPPIPSVQKHSGALCLGHV